MNNHLKELLILALSTSILVVQEIVFSFLPNIQLTTLLILVYTKVFGFKKTLLIVFVYIFIDNLLYGSLTMIHIVLPMTIAWVFVLTTFSLISKYSDAIIVYVILGYLYGHVYGLIFVPFQAFVIEVDLLAYLIIDIPWQVIMGISNALSILWLFQPLTERLGALYIQHIKGCSIK